MFRKLFSVIVLAAVSTLSAAPAPQKPKPAATLPEVVVTAKEDQGEPSLTVPSSESAAQKLNKVAGGTNLIKGEELKKGRVNTWRDVFQNAPGVYVQPRFGAEEARVSIRGSGAQRTFHGRGLAVLQDGIPVNFTDGAFDMQSIEPLASDYVSVWRGGNALRYGAANLGGAVDFISQTGYTADRAQIRTEYGSFDTKRGQISTGDVVGPVDYYLSLNALSQNGYRNYSQQDSQKLVSNLGWKLNSNWENRAYLTAVNTRSQLPGNLTKAQLEKDPTQAAAANIALNQQRNFELVRLADKLSWKDKEQSLDLSAYGSWKDLDHPISIWVDQESLDLGTRVAYENESELFGRKNRATIGANFGYGTVNANQFVNNTGTRGAQNADASQMSQHEDLFFENQHYLTEKFALVAGSQLTRDSRDNTDHFLGDGNQTLHESYTSWNPKVGALYDFTPDIVGFVNFSRSSEPPTFSELGSASVAGIRPIDQQIAHTVEVGSRGEADRFEWDATWYYAWLQDEYLTVNNGAGVSLGTTNATATHHQGLELGLKTKIWEGLWESGTAKDSEQDLISIRQTYLWSRFQFDSDPIYGSNSIGGFPEHVYRAELVYEHPNGFYVGPNVDWVPTKAPVDHANTLFAEQYVTMGAKIGFRQRKGFSVYLEAKNLFDARYAATTGVIADARVTGSNSAQFLAGDARAFYGGVEYRW